MAPRLPASSTALGPCLAARLLAPPPAPSPAALRLLHQTAAARLIAYDAPPRGRRRDPESAEGIEAEKRVKAYRRFVRDVGGPLFRNPSGRAQYPVSASKSEIGRPGGAQINYAIPLTARSSRHQPFPLNRDFRSEDVLSDAAREEIWRRVAVAGEPVKVVSAALGVEVRRVVAVVRLKELERRWTKEGKPLMRLYADAVWRMLPVWESKTNMDIENTLSRGFEPINDLHVHKLTQQQIFVPVPESQPFTRADAARAFHPKLLPPDERVPLASLVEAEKEARRAGHAVTSHELLARFDELETEAERRRVEREARRREREEKSVRRVVVEHRGIDAAEVEGADGEKTLVRKVKRRIEYRFEDFKVEDVGRLGRDRKGVGIRYGLPFDDRRGGTVKIPTKVE